MLTFDPHLEILPAAQQQLWSELKPAADLGFILYGGTAIALQLGHRQSIDFDFFSDKKLNKELLRDTFSFFKTSTLLQDREESLTVAVPFLLALFEVDLRLMSSQKSLQPDRCYLSA